MSSGVTRLVTGAFTGTGASLDIETVGFSPLLVKVYNTGGDCLCVWTKEMADAMAMKLVDSGAGATDISTITSNGITPLANGFTLGADTDLNVDGQQCYFEAWG